MTRGRPRSGEIDRAVHRATLELLADGGPAAVTIEGIAARAGLNRRSVYRRGADPVALIVAAFQALALDDVLPDTGTVAGDLLAIARTLADAHRSSLGMAVNELALLACRRPDAADGLRRVMSRRVAAFRTVIERAVTRGELPQESDPVLLFDLLGGAVWSRATRGTGPLDTPTLEAMVAAVLGRRPSPPPGP